METITLSDVKVFYNQNDQNYFWRESWQSRIREAEADIEAGHVKVASAETIDSVLEWLDEWH